MKATREKRDLQRDLDSLLDFKTDLVKGIDHLHFMLKNSVQKVLYIEDKESFKIAEKDMKRLIIDWIGAIQSFFVLEQFSESDCSGEDESDSLGLETSELDYFKKRLVMLILELRKSLQIIKKNIGAMFKKTEKSFNSFFKEEKLTLFESKITDVKASLSHCRKTFVLIEETLLESNLHRELTLANACSTQNHPSSSYNDIVKMELGATSVIDARTDNHPKAMCSSQQHSLQKTTTQKPISGSEGFSESECFTKNAPSYRIWKVTVHEVESPCEIYLKICDNIPENIVKDLQDYNTEKIIQMARSQELLKCSLFGISPASNEAEWREHDKANFKYLFMDSSSVFDVRFLLELQDSKDKYYIADRILDEDRSAKYEMYNPGEFPKRGSIVSLVITKIRSQNDLVGVILAQEQDSETEIDPETLTSLMEAMQRFYKGTKCIDFKGRPCEGELFAARSSGDDSWYRSRVIDVYGDVVEVYDVDTGYQETIPITNLRILQNQFAHLPEQAVDIGLSNIQILDTWSTKEAEWYEEAMMEN
ncbi:hypothetical protein QYM36_001826, partial [Artemia franciscana]